MSQSPKLFITVTLLVCSITVHWQSTEGQNSVKDLQDFLRNRLNECDSAAKRNKVVSSCKYFVYSTVQPGDPALKKCCDKLGVPEFGQECFCLLRRKGRETPVSDLTKYQKKRLRVLEAISIKKLFINSCAALSGFDDCSVVSNALKTAAYLEEMT